MRPAPMSVKVHPLLALAQQHAHRPQADDFAAEDLANNEPEDRSFEPEVSFRPLVCSFPEISRYPL